MRLIPSCCPVCERRGCATPAAGVLALEVRLARFQIDGSDYLRRVTDRALCAVHLAEINPQLELRDALTALGDTVDPASARAVLLPFDHPEVVRMREKARAA